MRSHQHALLTASVAGVTTSAVSDWNMEASEGRGSSGRLAMALGLVDLAPALWAAAPPPLPAPRWAGGGA